MIKLKIAALGLAALTLSGGAAFAQDAMAKGDMMKGMSKHDSMMMTKCQGMDHAMMMKNKSCKTMMKKHPGMMSDSGVMKGDGMMKH